MTSAIATRLTPESRSHIRQKLVEVAMLPAKPFRRLATPFLMRRHDKLHLGSGARLLEGWANIDIGGVGTLLWDLRKPLPIKARKVRLVYTEHFIEHIDRADALRLFTHAREVMAPGAILRVSTPDLRKVADDYLNGRVVEMPHGGWYPKTPCRMLNEAVRWWGHVFLYDEAELTGLLDECGYSDIRRVAWGASETPGLRGLESRPDFGDLIVEARA
jgi:predicted SAM-dependent methyltransferase